MGILSIGFNNSSLDDVSFDEDNPETIIHVKLNKRHVRQNKCKQRKAFKKDISKS